MNSKSRQALGAVVTARHRRGSASRGTSTPEPGLTRRLLITCPETGLLTDSGVDTRNRPTSPDARQLLIDCLECGQDHVWRIDEATWEPSHNPAIRNVTKEESHAIRN